MAELRSFIIGVTIAGALLLVGGLAFGLFGGDTSGSPRVSLLGTPPATRTPPPAATRDPSELTPVVPSATSEGAAPGRTPGSDQPAGNTTPNAIQTATPTLEVAPTAAATATQPVPETNPVDEYIASANQYSPALLAQVEYLIGNAGAPNLGAAEWRQFTLESVASVQSLAGGIAGLTAPGCVSGAHSSLVAAANEASAAAGALAAAVNANDAAAISAAGGGLGTARSLLGGAVAEVSNTIGSAC